MSEEVSPDKWFPNWKQFRKEGMKEEVELTDLILGQVNWTACGKRSRLARQIYNWMLRTGKCEEGDGTGPYTVGPLRTERLRELNQIIERAKTAGAADVEEDLQGFRKELLSGKYSYCQGNQKTSKMVNAATLTLHKRVHCPALA